LDQKLFSSDGTSFLAMIYILKFVNICNGFRISAGEQWRRQDLLQREAKMEIMSWGTHGGLQGRVQQLLDD